MQLMSGINKDIWACLYPVVFLFLWAIGFVALKIGLQYSDPFTFLALRYVCVLALLIPLVLWLRPRFPSSKRGWVALIGVPPVTALVAFVFIGESLTLISLPGMALAAAGIYIVTQKT